jgi:RHS repeat-associated protein
MIRSPSLFSILATVLTLGAPALASTGVADERVSLPDGPGSIGGIGENADIDPNMGMMRTSVPFELPEGRPGLTPDLRLSYSSGGGASVVGVGWSFDAPTIERTSLRGLPRYTGEDEFAADGGEELVLTEPGTRTYRARFEKAFARYRWHDVGAGDEGHWTKEEPDGRVHYYGADETGTLVPEARVAGDGGTFRYHLVATVNPYGDAIRYSYTKSGGTSLLSRVDYLFDDAGAARFSVLLTYEDRPDWISDCESGANIILDKRLSGVVVLSQDGATATPMRRLFLRYEDGDTSGGASRLAEVTTFGVGDEPFPGKFSFGYSASLTGACTGSCEGPYAGSLGTLPGGVVLQNGRATLIDMNADGLPDVLSTPSGGGHNFILTTLDDDGLPRFASTATSSGANVGTGFVLDAPSVQVLDVDGDGLTDIISGSTGEVRCNDGSGDWNGTGCLMDAGLPTLEADEVGDADPRFVRFFDYDNDKRIDLLRTGVGTTEVLHNTPAGFVSVDVAPIESVFDQDPLDLADLNGDGLQDPAELLPDASVRYRLNLGYGRWSAWTTVSLSGFDGVDPTFLELQDVNGDGLDDVVAVVGAEVLYAINRNGDRFDAARTLTASDVEGGLPTRDTGTQVLFADMNGSGTDDIVWFQPDGSATFVELFPVRPNLLTRVENGLGRVQVVEYGTSVEQQRVSPRAWQYRLPNAMNVVVRTDSWVTLTGDEDGVGLHEEVVFRYFDGFYDGEDHRFRGFGEVELDYVADAGADGQPSSRVTMVFDVGATDVYRNGLLTERITEAQEGGQWVAIRTESAEYDDCELTGVPDSGLSFPVRFVCVVASETVHQDGAPAADWVTTRTEQVWDGYGNVVESRNLGVVQRGDSGCESCTHEAGEFGVPCGAMCLGDERFVETDYVVPGANTGGAWFLRSPTSERSYSVAGGLESETRTYYDAPDFVGMDLGLLTQGTPTRVETLAESGRWLQAMRVALDDHGNTIEELDALGAAGEANGHRRVVDYDALGFRVLAVRALLSDADGVPYALEREASYDPVFLKLASMSNWRVLEGGSPVTPTETTRFTYDPFGRAATVALPDDDVGAPSLTYDYELGDPVSRIVVRRRSEAGGALDLARATCHDGLGREVQARTAVGPGNVLVSGFVAYNRQGNPVREYEPHSDTSLACADAPPAGVPFTATEYDAVDRVVSVVLPDGDVFESASELRVEYRPLERRSWDAEDTDASSPHFDTFTIDRYDGLGRTVATERSLGDDVATWALTYDGLGNVASLTDASGNVKRQVWDLAGRVLEVRDPNAGDFAFAWDDEGNLVERIDARGASTQVVFDGMNRPLTKLDPDDAEASRIDFFYDLPSSCGDCTYPAGHLARVDYPLGASLSGTGSDVIHRDARGRTVAFERSLHGQSFRVDYGFDHADRIVSTRFPDGTELTRTFDGADRLVSIGGALDEQTYDERGLVSASTFANGVVTTRAWDGMRRLASLATTSGGDALLELAMSHDRVGTVKEVAHSNVMTGGVDLSATFAHDDWYRVTSATFASAETVAYGLDLLSNVTERTSDVAGSAQHLGALAYDDARPNAVTTAGDLSYSYDASGQVTQRGEHSLTWDYQGRLESYAGERVHAYAYGPGEQRVGRRDADGLTLYVAPDFEIRDGVAVTYARTGRTRVARLENLDFQTSVLDDKSGDGTINAADAWLAGADLEREELLFASARRQVSSTGTTFLHEDNLGSLVAATSESGEVVGQRAFTLDGAVRESSGHVDRYGFTGQEHDATGLVHYRFRTLDPHSGRWLSVDPAFLVAATADLAGPDEATGGYTYVGGQSTSLIDQMGLNGSQPAKVKKGAKATPGKKKKRRRRGRRKKKSTDTSSDTSTPKKPGPTGGGGGGGGSTGGTTTAVTGKLDWTAVVPKKGPYKGQSRKDHVGLHNVDNTSKPSHGVFSGDGVSITNEAWGKAVEAGQKPSPKGQLIVSMGRKVGRSGGSSAVGKPQKDFTRVKIIVVSGTNNIITAYPME